MSIPKGKDYLLTEGKPLDLLIFSGNYDGFRMRIEGDTAELFSPFLRHRERVPAYAGDSLATFSDVRYIVYEVQPDSSLHVIVRDSSGIIGRQLYVLGERLSVHDMSDAVPGYTYRLDLDGTRYLAYFAEEAIATGPVAEVRVHLFREDPDFQGVKRISSGLSKRASYRSIPVYFPYDAEEAGGRRGILLFTGDGAGQPQAYVAHDTAMHDPVGPIPLQRLHSVLPEAVGMQELSELLNHSRVSIGTITDEPAPGKLKYAYQEDFERLGGMVAREVEQLDFEFTEEGAYTVFSGDRVIGRGDWSLTPDRNFIELTDAIYGGSRLHFIDAFTGDSLTLEFPLLIKTSAPHGTQLESYYEAVAMINFNR
ncbi:hypothetical protein [Lewinella sp. IMCC34191]|uniref:hypothetical protein n=1 Tax=Lewinella sp. IMCC34191 TaxID=2259172 RepID=UPI0018E57E8A|nr:hypothetical protein [Lewinella sp. IMCC34191]